MKKILVLMIALICLNLTALETEDLFLQQNINDTLALSAPLDVLQDSTAILNSEELLELTMIDSTNNYRKRLKTEMDSFISEIDFSVPISYFYNENFHIKTAIEPDITIIKNGFTLLGSGLKNSVLLQTHLPFYKAKAKRDLIFLDNSNYNLVVPITVTYLGLGDQEMNRGFISYKKGNLFNITDFNIETSYLGHAGNWFNVNEKSSNFDIHLFYAKSFGELHFYSTKINQNFSSLRSTISTSDTICDDNLFENSVIFKNKFIDLGYKRSQAEVDTIRYNFEQYYLSKTITSEKNFFQASLEHFTGDYDFSSIRLLHHSEFALFRISNNGFYRTNAKHYLTSEITAGLKHLFISGEYINSNNKNKYKKYIGKIGTNFDLIKVGLNLGKQIQYLDEWCFSELSTSITIPTHFTDYMIENKTAYLIDAPDKYPNIKSNTKAQMHFDLDHQNFIDIGLSHIYCGNYKKAANTYNASNFDLFLKVQITPYFELYANIVNLFDNNDMFEQMNSVPGRHLNYGVKWIFVN